MGVCQSAKNNTKPQIKSERAELSQYEFEDFMKLSSNNRKKGILIKFKLFEIINNKRVRIAKYLFIEYNGNITSRVSSKTQTDIVYFGKLDDRGNINITSEVSNGNTIRRRTFEGTLDDNFKAVGIIKEKDYPNTEFELTFYTNKFCTLETKKTMNVMMRYKHGVVSGISKDREGYICLWGGIEDKGKIKIFERRITDNEDIDSNLYIGTIDKIMGIIEGKLHNDDKFIMKSSKFQATTI
jgi:hypothetical protein